MEKVDFIAELTALTSQEDVLAVSNEVNDLRAKFNDFINKEESAKAQEEESSEEVKEETPEAPVEEAVDVAAEETEEVVSPESNENAEEPSLKDAFYKIYNEYKEKKKAVIDERNELEAKNLAEKQGLISRLKDVVSNEENIGSAFASFKEIQEQWKAIGDIPRAKRSDVQAEYSKLLEDFFYNIKIYKELKDHDFHRNYQLKTGVIDRLKTLIEVKSIKEVETQLKSIQNDWEDIGPVPNEKWEEVKDAYWTEVRSSYERINRFYDDRRSQQVENLKKKEELLAATKEISATINSLENVKDWDVKTSAILEIQKKWKSIGFGPKKENEEIWKAFRGECDTFFNAKKAYFGKVNEKFDGVAAKKQELIDKAISFQDSTDWKETSNKLIQLQKQWKTLGHAGRKNEQKLWKAFRTACDGFFNARQAHFSEQDKAFEDNLTAKQELLKEIEGFKLPTEKKEALDALKEFSNKFNAIGRVPMKAKDATYKAFKAAMDAHYGALKMEGKEKDAILFQAKIDTIQSSPNSSRLFNDMKFDLRKEIDKQQKEIALLGNNLGFFANSKGADALKKDVEKKIARAQGNIDAIKAKLKMVPNE